MADTAHINAKVITQQQKPQQEDKSYNTKVIVHNRN